MKTTNLCMVLVSAILSLFIFGCNDNEDPMLEVSGEKEFLLPASGGDFTVAISSNVEYEIKMPQVEWLCRNTISTGMSHTFTVLPNETYDARIAIIEFIDKDSSLKTSVKVSQSCSSALIVEKETYVEGWEAHILEMKIQSNVKFEVKLSDSWISQTDSRGLAEHLLRFNLRRNDSGETRETIVKLVGEGIEQDVTIKQEGNAERNILVALYQSTGGDKWLRKENWCSDKPLDQWEGVTTIDGYVSILDFVNDDTGNNMSGNFRLSGLKHLSSLNISNNKLTGLELSELPNLTYVLASQTPLEYLNLEELPKIKNLDFTKCAFAELDLRHLKTLENIAFEQSRNLESLKIDGLTSLKELGIPYCPKLTGKLDLTEFINLEKFWCYGCNFSSIKIAGLKQLKNVNVAINKLSELDVSGLERLETLSINSNNISQIDVSGLKNITLLDLDNNPLSNIDLTHNKKITYFSGRFCWFTKLDLSLLPSLLTVHCDGNQLTELNVSNLNLSSLWCDDNQIRHLDLSASTNITNNTGSIVSNLICEDNPLETVILPGNAKNYGIFTGWGENNNKLYFEPEHRDSYQYPRFFYVGK